MTGGMIGGAAIGAVNNAVSQGMSSLAREENFYYNEKAADNAMQRQKELYEMISSPAALRQQYIEAGLSPGLMFAGNGAGGGTVPNAPEGAGSSGIQPTTYGISAADMAQIELMNAQKENIKADTQQKLAETQKTKVDIDKVIAETNNVELKNEWQQFENVSKLLQTQIDEQTQQDYIDIQHLEVEKVTKQKELLEQQLRSAKVKGDIDEETEKSVIQYVKNQVSEQMANIVLTKCKQWKTFADIQMDVAQMSKLIWDIKASGKGLEQKDNEIQINRDALEEQVRQWAAENGYKEKDQQIAIAKTVVNAWIAMRGQNRQFWTNIINAVSPFGGDSGIPYPANAVTSFDNY